MRVAWVILAGCGRIGFDTSALDAVHTTCADLVPTCGPNATSSCCTSVLVSGGTFFRTYDVGTDGMFTDMTHPATISTFRLDVYEVTVGRFRQFVAAGKGTQLDPPAPGAGAHTQIPGSGWDASFTADLEADTPALVAALKC